MAGDNLNVWYDRDGDHLEIVFDQKAGFFEDTSLANVRHKRDAEGNLLAISISNLSLFAGTRALLGLDSRFLPGSHQERERRAPSFARARSYPGPRHGEFRRIREGWRTRWT